MQELDKLNRLTESHGALRPGKGLISGVIALSLAILCFLGVLAFHFPEYLTTPQLRKSYDVDVLRQVMYWAMVIAGGIALVNIVFGRSRWLAAGAFVLVALTALLGGHKVPVNDFADNTPYIGLDWFILDLLGSSLIFIFVEKLFPLRKNQPVFRAEWQTDFHHFIVNHMVVGFVLLATNLLVHKLFGWAAKDGVQAWVQGLPFPVALFGIILVADLVRERNIPFRGRPERIQLLFEAAKLAFIEREFHDGRKQFVNVLEIGLQRGTPRPPAEHVAAQLHVDRATRFW